MNIYCATVIFSLFTMVLANCTGQSGKANKNTEQQSVGAMTTPVPDNLKKGRRIVIATKKVLERNLFAAIQHKGTAGALSFCNERAYLLTDSMSIVLNARIKRVSDKNRNPQNNANADELAYIYSATQQIKLSGEAKPTLHEQKGKTIAYYPIVTNAMCLQCHGKPHKDIGQETLARITSLYPDDKAQGYDVNQLRGIWVVDIDMKH